MCLPQVTLRCALVLVVGLALVLAGAAPNGAAATTSSPNSSTAGILGCAPSSLDFGNVPVGQSKTLSAQLSNTGGSTLTITQVLVQGPGFQIKNLSAPATLAPGGTVQFTVTFAPVSTVPSGATISLFSNASNSVFVLSLSGTGTGTATTTAGTTAALTASPTSLSFGSVAVGTSETKSQTLTYTGSSAVSIIQAAVTGRGFSVSGLNLPIVLTPQQSFSFKVIFAPTSAGSVSGTLSIALGSSSQTLTVPLSGTGTGTGGTSGQLSANPTTLSFGSVQVGASQTKSQTVTNSGGSTLSITKASVTGNGFSDSGLSLPLVLTPGQSFTFKVIFAPASAGAATGTLSLTPVSSTALTVPLSGSGTSAGQLSVSPTTLSFGNVAVGATSTSPASLSASGASVTVTSAALSSTEFGLSGISFPATVAAGKSLSFSVTFTPQASGAASGNISFSSSASGTATETVSGTGTAASQHEVVLSWTDNGSGITGYNIYRGSASSGPYTKINPALNSGTSYTDTTVQAGTTYYYTTTAVSTGGMESQDSNVVKAVIPSP